MGYRGRRTRHILFEDGSEFPGLDMRADGISIDEWLNVSIEDSIELFAERLIEWNYEDDDGNPVPCTAEAIRRQDASEMRTLVSEWFRRVTEVRRPLGQVPTARTPAMNGAATNPAIEGGLPMSPPPQS